MERRIESVVPVGTEKKKGSRYDRYKYANTCYSTYQKLWMICISFAPILFVGWGFRLSSSGTRDNYHRAHALRRYGIQYAWRIDNPLETLLST
jgi:hypothetical protein